MRNYVTGVVLSGVLLLLGAACASPPAEPPPIDAPAIAEKFVGALARQEYLAASDMLETLQKAVYPPEKLRAVWATYVAEYGEFQSQTAAAGTPPASGAATARVKCSFAGGVVNVDLKLNSSGQISGLAFSEGP